MKQSLPFRHSELDSESPKQSLSHNANKLLRASQILYHTRHPELAHRSSRSAESPIKKEGLRIKVRNDVNKTSCCKHLFRQQY